MNKLSNILIIFAIIVALIICLSFCTNVGAIDTQNKIPGSMGQTSLISSITIKLTFDDNTSKYIDLDLNTAVTPDNVSSLNDTANWLHIMPSIYNNMLSDQKINNVQILLFYTNPKPAIYFYSLNLHLTAQKSYNASIYLRDNNGIYYNILMTKFTGKYYFGGDITSYYGYDNNFGITYVDYQEINVDYNNLTKDQANNTILDIWIDNGACAKYLQAQTALYSQGYQIGFDNGYKTAEQDGKLDQQEYLASFAMGEWVNTPYKDLIQSDAISIYKSSKDYANELARQYDLGYAAGVKISDVSFDQLLSTVIGTQYDLLKSTVDVDIFGVNIFAVIGLILGIGLLLWIIKRIKQ